MLNGVIDCIRTYYNLGDMEITENSKLTFDLGLESYDIIEMCGELEERFSVVISENDLTKIETVGDLTKYIANYKLKNPARS